MSLFTNYFILEIHYTNKNRSIFSDTTIFLVLLNINNTIQELKIQANELVVNGRCNEAIEVKQALLSLLIFVFSFYLIVDLLANHSISNKYVWCT